MRRRIYLFLVATLLVSQLGCGGYAAPPAVTFTISPTQAKTSENLSAAPAKEYFSAKIGVTGSALERREEGAKCKDLLSLNPEIPTAVFDDAVSSFGLQFTIVELRDNAGLGAAWKRALDNISRDGEFKFEIPQGASYFPIVSDVSVAVSDPQFTDKLDDRSEQFLLQRFKLYLNKVSKESVTEFDRTGIIRGQTDDQAVVCFGALVSKTSLNILVRGRTFDRISIIPLLESKCVARTLREISKRMQDQGTRISDTNSPSTFGLLFGVHLASTSSIFAGDSYCSLSKKNEIGSDLKQLTAWTSIAERWRNAASEANLIPLSDSQIEEFLLLASERKLTPTGINYSASMSAELGPGQ